MQFQVPQFIEIEDKIFGPLTFKQFLYILGGVGLSYITWSIASRFIGGLFSVVFIIPILAFFGALAFYKVHPREPFVKTVENAMRYYAGKKLYLWKKESKPAEQAKRSSDSLGINENVGSMVPKLTDSKLKEISWGLDINENIK
jgi:hypothetical protein